MLPEQRLDLLHAVCLEAGHTDDLFPDGERLIAVLQRLEQHRGAGDQHRTDQAQADRHGKYLAGVVVGPGEDPQAAGRARLRDISWHGGVSSCGYWTE